MLQFSKGVHSGQLGGDVFTLYSHGFPWYALHIVINSFCEFHKLWCISHLSPARVEENLLLCGFKSPSRLVVRNK